MDSTVAILKLSIYKLKNKISKNKIVYFSCYAFPILTFLFSFLMFHVHILIYFLIIYMNLCIAYWLTAWL